ncbi:hypothetical protein [Microcoleus sp. OTE_8_concoct_300]|uniref:hypothetical protein n=1 Tax=Microcoleus sp. OTE_8_concoct_300 TaxID=2964710 RepID=UPI00403FAFDA
MGLGWNVHIKNETSKKITVTHSIDRNCYPNDFEGSFDINSGTEIHKYTEMKSSVFSPLKKSFLIIVVQIEAQGKGSLIELKGRNGDLEKSFRQLVHGDGFEIGIQGEPNYKIFRAKKKEQVEVYFTFY